MIASREVELPYYKGVGRQRGRGFGVLAQVNGRIAIPFLKNMLSQLLDASVLIC